MGLMMARPPQQPPDASGRGGRPGAQDPQAECIGPALPARRISPQRRLGWAIAAAALVLAPGVYFLAHSASAGPKGYVALPVRLLGMSQDTSIEGEQLVSRLKRTERRVNHGVLTGVVAGVYGSFLGTVMVAGGAKCGSCAHVSASQLKSGMVASGYTNVRLFPPGPKGGEMACGTDLSSRPHVIRCARVADRTAGTSCSSTDRRVAWLTRPLRASR
jgi:hypothetical protein